MKSLRDTDKRYGPRSRVFSYLSRYAQPKSTPGWSKTVLTHDGKSSKLLEDDSIPKDLKVGDMRLYSYYVPGLRSASYTAVVTQNISIPNNGAHTLSSKKEFKVSGPMWSIDSRVVYSIYPPPGHTDHPSVLPNIVFSDPNYPWLVDMPRTEPSSTGTEIRTPWLGLIVFADSEITPSSSQIETIQGQLQATQSSTILSQDPMSKAFTMQLSDLLALDGVISQPVEAIPDGDATVNVVLANSTVFDDIFAKYSNPPDVNRVQSIHPDLTCFTYTSHVKNVNVPSLPGNASCNEVGRFAVTITPRTGPLDLKDDSAVYVHLVSLANISQHITTPSGKSQGLTALVSLYSWSYTCTTPEKISVYDTLVNLGESAQPLRIPDSLDEIAGSETNPNIKWTKERMQAGYSLVRYRLRTGEQTMALQRGPLSPVSIPHPLDGFPRQSNFGTDLAILNKDFGVLDLTYQLAWQLGRTVAMSERDFVGALLRLRTGIHERSLAAAKVDACGNFRSEKKVLQTFKNTVAQLKGAYNQLKGERELTFSQRWRRQPLEQPIRSQLSLRTTAIQESQAKLIPGMINEKAQSSGLLKGLYNEFNSPVSTDYAVILGWCLDRLFLHGIPYHYILPQPLTVPNESIRTFYVDDNWLDVFLDGALSIGNYYTRETDVIRRSLKATVNSYLRTHLPNGHPPQIPRWGFILRSEIVTKFPDLIISAPWPDPKDERLEVLKMERPEINVLICLFDRVPEEGCFGDGITLIPPEHQLKFQLGFELSSDHLEMEWKRVYADPDCPQEYNKGKGLPKQTYHAENQKDGCIFDFNCHRLIFPSFADAASTAQNWPGNPKSNIVGPSPALVGVQLIADIPKLRFQNPTSVSCKEPPARALYTGPQDFALWFRPTVLSGPPLSSRGKATVRDPFISPSLDKRNPSGTVNRGFSEKFKDGEMFSLDVGSNKRAPWPMRRLPSRPISQPNILTETGIIADRGDLPSQVKCSFICGARGFTTPINYKEPYALIRPYGNPSSQTPLPSLVDQGFSIIAQPKEPGWCLEYIEVMIPVGNRAGDLFYPFQTGSEELYTVEMATLRDMPATATNSMGWSPPSKPETSFQRLNIPKVQPFSRARRFIPSVSYHYGPDDPPGCGQMIVRMSPLPMSGCEIMKNYDMSFLIQEPNIRWALGQEYIIKIQEKYQSWPGYASSSGYANSSLVIKGCWSSTTDDGELSVSC